MATIATTPPSTAVPSGTPTSTRRRRFHYSDNVYFLDGHVVIGILLGILLPETRLPRLAKNRVLYKDGLPLAVLEKNEVRFLREVDEKEQWQLQQVLTQRDYPTRLRAYIGR